MEPARAENKPVPEELVAYLDGELDPVAQRQLEERLRTDRSYRRQWQRLQRVWKCLDELPHATVAESFPRTTVQMAVVAAAEEVERAGGGRSAASGHWRRRLMLIGVCLATALTSFLIALVAWPAADRQPVPNSPIPAHADLSGELAPADLAAVVTWLHDLVNANPRIRQFLADNQHAMFPKQKLAPWQRDRLRRADPRRRRIALALYLLQRAESDKPLAWLREEDIGRLRTHLSPDAQRALDQATSPGQRRRLLIDWLKQAGRRPGGPWRRDGVGPPVSAAVLEGFFARDLDDRTRTTLLQLPPDEMERRVRQLYLQEHATSTADRGKRHRHRPAGPRSLPRRADP